MVDMMEFGFLPREALVRIGLIKPIVKKPGDIDPVIVQEEMDPETFFTNSLRVFLFLGT